MMTFMPDISTDPHDADHWKKDATRQAILAAARQLSAREGVEAVTLGRVAAEAGFAATVVYTYFVTKDDLHLALVADDLETIAEVMRQGSSIGDEEGMHPEVVQEIPAAAAAMTTSHLVEKPDGETSCGTSAPSLAQLEWALGVVRQTEEDFLSEPGPEREPIPDAFPGESVDEAYAAASQVETRYQLERTEALANSLPVPATGRAVVAGLAVVTGATDASRWGEPGDIAGRLEQIQSRILRLERGLGESELERRLDSIERSLSAFDIRLAQVEQDVERTRTKFEEDHGRLTNQIAEALGTSHRSLLERSEQHAVVVGDLRAYVKELTGRLSAVENWLARTSRLATSDNDRNVLSTLARESGVTDTDSGTGGEGFAASTRPSARSRKTPPGWSRRAHWLVVSLVLLLAIGGVGAAIRFQLLGHAPTTGSSVATLPTGASVDARVVAMAKAGSAKAELVAGLKLLNGDGTATDVPSAAYWLRKAALQNQPVAEYWLATLYERGRAVPKDLTQAMQWYAKAAIAGNAKAMYRLGVAYAEGWAGTPDYVAAAKWFSAAAQYGIIDAQFNLGVLYERGSGVPMSLKNAFTWYAIAATQGDAQSKARLDVLAAHMSSSDVQAAQAAASAFKVLTPPPADNDAPDPAVLARQL